VPERRDHGQLVDELLQVDEDGLGWHRIEELDAFDVLEQRGEDVKRLLSLGCAQPGLVPAMKFRDVACSMMRRAAALRVFVSIIACSRLWVMAAEMSRACHGAMTYRAVESGHEIGQIRGQKWV
jgi:hypothetical protein